MKIIKKWVNSRKRFPFRKKSKKPICEDSVFIEPPEISSNLEILNNQTHYSKQSPPLIYNKETLPTDYQHGNCVCLFIMLVCYYVSIIATKVNNSLRDNINRHK